MAGPFEWRLQDIERKADEANRRLYEIDALRSYVNRVECTNRELGSAFDGIRIELQAAQDRISALEQEVIALKEEVQRGE